MGPSEGDTHTYTHKTAVKVIALTFQGLNQEAQTQIDSYLVERMGNMITNNLNWKA